PQEAARELRGAGDLDVDRLTYRAAYRQDVAGRQLQQVARAQVRVEAGRQRHRNASEVFNQTLAILRALLLARAMPALREVGAHGLDDRRREREVQHSARVADLDVEHEEDEDLVRGRDLQHLRPRLARVNPEVDAADRLPELRQVLEQQSHDGVDDVLLDLRQRAAQL